MLRPGKGRLRGIGPEDQAGDELQKITADTVQTKVFFARSRIGVSPGSRKLSSLTKPPAEGVERSWMSRKA